MMLMVSTGSLWAQDQIVVRPAYKPVCQLFSLSDVRVTDEQFRHIQELDHEYLLSLDVNRLLSWFRREAGVSQRGYDPYPYWESEDLFGGGPLSGHIMGFWLSSMSMMYQTTGDDAILPKVQEALEGLRECQLADGEGFIGAQPNVKSVFAEVAKGNFTTTNPLINKTWEPVYVMNKTMLGLYNVYLTMHFDLAKTILVDLADWFGTAIIDKLDHDQMQKLLVCEHGSINESYIDVYSITGEQRFLDWANRLNDEDMWVPAAEGRDVLQGWHANTQIPKFTGFERIRTYTGNQDFLRAPRFFWQTVVDRHTWANGGNSTGEHFFPINEFEQRIPSTGGPESCNSVNMMRLTEALYQADGDMKYVDYYERVLINHVLANFDPEQGMCVYYTSMRPTHYKVYGTKYDSFWCCTGTGLEAPAKFAKMTYAHNDNTLFVNLYISSDVNWKEQGLTLRQTTTFPVENTSTFTVDGDAAQELTLAFRHPWWSEHISVKVNGTEQDAAANEHNGYVSLQRRWKKGDVIEVTLEPKLRAEIVKGGLEFYALMYGPVLLGIRIDDPTLTAGDYRKARSTVGSRTWDMTRAPEIDGNIEALLASIQRNDSDGILRFYVPAEHASKEFYLEPYNNIHFSRYAIYLHVANGTTTYLNAHVSKNEWGIQWGNMVPIDMQNDAQKQLLMGAAHVYGNESPFSGVLKKIRKEWKCYTSFTGASDRPTYSVCDINGDGNVDVVVSETAETVGTQGIYIGKGTGQFTFTPMTIVDAGESLPGNFSQPFSDFRFVQSSYVADFNNDGRPDIVGIGNNENFVVLLNQGEMTFKPVYFDPGTEYGGKGHNILQAVVVAADVNNDGWKDIALSCWKRNVGEGQGHDRQYFTEVYLNDGEGSHFSRTYFADYGCSMADGGIALGDLNGDGHIDMVINGHGGIYAGTPAAKEATGHDDIPVINRMLLLFNDGTGHFTLAPQEYFEKAMLTNVTSGPNTINLYDWDGDGWLDIIANGWTPIDNNDCVGYIFINHQDGIPGKFAHRFNYAGGAEGTNCLFDWDGDGRKDIIANGYLRSAKYAKVTDRSFSVTRCEEKQTEAPKPVKKIKAKTEGSKVTLSWTPADDATASTTYELYIKTPEGVLLGNCRAYIDGDNEGLRKCEEPGNIGLSRTITFTLPEGKYEWGVQAVDGRRVGSTFVKGDFTLKTTAIKSPGSKTKGRKTTYNTQGQQIGDDYRGIAITEGRKTLM